MKYEEKEGFMLNTFSMALVPETEEEKTLPKVKCSHCGKESLYEETLPFVDLERGTYYCGCFGWG